MKKLVLILSFIFLILGHVDAYSEESATTHAHYEHPETGIIEDAGNNPGIGQGMCENVLHESALFEEVNGELFYCVRYNMANYINNVSFAIQNKGDENFISVDYEVVAETDTTRDYRFKVASKDIIVRSTFFVEPMGRDIVFYFDFSDFVKGNTDFIALGENGSMQNIVKFNTLGKDGNIVEVKAVNNLMNSGDLGYEHGLLLNDSPKIKEVYGSIIDKEDVKNVEKLKTEDSNSNLSNFKTYNTGEHTEWGFITKTMFQNFMFLITTIVIILILLAFITSIYSKYLISINSVKEEVLDEKY